MENKTMKTIIVLSMLTAWISCTNNTGQKGVDTQIVSTAIMGDTCHPLSAFVNYQTESERDRTIDFVEGQDTFRLLSDTDSLIVYLQKKIGYDCWKTLERVFRNSGGGQTYGVDLIDINDDGFIDIRDKYKMFTEITFYDPQMKGFRNDTLTEECSNNDIFTLPNKVKYSICSCCPNQLDSDVSSDLYKFKDFKTEGYATLRVSPRQKTIVLSSDGDERSWQLKEFPAFMRESDFDADEFIKDYWTKNWKRFVRD